jgi:hypothetical protein
MKRNDRKKRGATIALSIMLLMIMGCSAHSPFTFKNTYQIERVSDHQYEPHTNKVLISWESLPPTAKYEIISYIDVGRVWYGSLRRVHVSMAYMARELGADAVIAVKTWYQPHFWWAWITPHGSGVAVKIIDPSSVDLKEVRGYWY